MNGARLRAGPPSAGRQAASEGRATDGEERADDWQGRRRRPLDQCSNDGPRRRADHLPRCRPSVTHRVTDHSALMLSRDELEANNRRYGAAFTGGQLSSTPARRSVVNGRRVRGDNDQQGEDRDHGKAKGIGRGRDHDNEVENENDNDRDSDSRMRSASRKVGRETAYCAINSASGGRLAPSGSSPLTIRKRISLAINSGIRVARTNADRFVTGAIGTIFF